MSQQPLPADRDRLKEYHEEADLAARVNHALEEHYRGDQSFLIPARVSEAIKPGNSRTHTLLPLFTPKERATVENAVRKCGELSASLERAKTRDERHAVCQTLAGCFGTLRACCECLDARIVAALDKRPAEPRKTAAEYNVEAREYLRKNPEAGPRELRTAIGCGMGTVYKLPAYQAVREARKRGRKPKAVSLTKEMADVTTKADGELAKLVREQRRDMTSNRVKPRERT
jgi:hypothetical protein